MDPNRVLQYDAPHPLYGVAFSNSPYHPYRTALTSLISSSSNKVSIIDLAQDSPAGPSYQQIASTSHSYPPTKVGWEPKESLSDTGGDGSRGELFATTGDVLRIWDLTESSTSAPRGGGFVGRNGWGEGGEGPTRHSVRERSVLTNSKQPASQLPPLTSFSWNPHSPSSIVTCSIDTTATIWDVLTSSALTQLIAHDRAVYDLSWLPYSSDIFVSVGADGSLRAFDLRALEHSTILYETADQTPLARIAFSGKEQHMMACFGLEEQKVLILDMRSPGQPVAELIGHQGALGAIGWGAGGNSTGGGWIASCGDDSQLLLYDLTEPLPLPASESKSHSKSSTHTPSTGLSPSPAPSSNVTSRSGTPASNGPSPELGPVRAWTAGQEINNLAWTHNGDSVGCVSGNTLSVLKA